MSYVPFLSDQAFKKIVNDILISGKDAQIKAKKEFTRNVIDPFAILFEMASFNVDFDSWYASEMARQSQKTLSNHVGSFHQSILGAIEGWTDLEVGQMVDLVNEDRKIIAEIKNKHNTLKGSNQIDLYQDLTNLVMPNGQKYKGFTAYYVEVIPKKPTRYNHPFTPSNKNTSTKCAPNELIRQIDGASFYALVTGYEDALEQVFRALPTVIKDCESSLSMANAAQSQKFFDLAYHGKS